MTMARAVTWTTLLPCSGKVMSNSEENLGTGLDDTVAAKDTVGTDDTSKEPIPNDNEAVEAVKDVTSTSVVTPTDTTDKTSKVAVELPQTSQIGLTPVAPQQLPAEASSPAPRRPRPPTKGILKPPPPPAKPTLTNRLRDIVTVVGGGAKSLFDPLEPENATAGPSTPQPPTVGGTLNAIGGRLSMGFSRLVSPPAPSSPASNPILPSAASPGGSPLPKTAALPEVATERSKPKQPLKRATFLLPSMSITYPISSSGEPWSQKVLDDRKRVSGLSPSDTKLG